MIRDKDLIELYKESFNEDKDLMRLHIELEKLQTMRDINCTLGEIRDQVSLLDVN